MEKITAFLSSIWHTKIISSMIIIMISIFLYKLISYFLKKSEKNDRFKFFAGKKSKTYLKLIRSIIRYIFIVITILVLLQINGVDVSSLLAGVGILGVVVGLAIQDWLKDIIRGSSILSDNYFSVGDVVKYNDIEGKVLIIGLKTTKIQDLKTSNIISIANRNIETMEVVSNFVYVNIPMAYEVPIKQAEKVIKNIVSDIQKNDNVNNCRYLGINELSESGAKYFIEIDCNPLYKLQIKRDALRSILLEMENNGIKVPYTQIDIHEK